MGGYLEYPEYKDSGVEWLGEIPSHWELKRLHHIARLRSGETMTADMMDENAEFPVYGGNGLRGYFDSYTHEGDYVLIGRQGALCGNINYATGKFWASEHAVVVSPTIELETFWLGELLRTMNLNQYSTSAAQPGISVEMIGRLKLPFPSLSEQESIARFLDYKTAQIDALIAKKETLLAKLAEKRTALISQAVTKGLDPTVPMKDSGIEWLGDIPIHWDIRKLHHIARLRSGETMTAQMMDADGEFPVYGGNGLRGYYHSYTHDGDYVLIGRQGALCGNINYASGKFWASEHAVVVSPTLAIETFWLGKLLEIMNLNQYSTSAAQPGISVEQIGRLKIPFPEYDEQKSISQYLNEQITHLNFQEEKINQVINKVKEYRTALITNAVTGKIDVRDVRLPELNSLEVA